MNNYFDHLFFINFFALDIAKNKVEIKITHQKLATDVAYEVFDDYLNEKIENGEDFLSEQEEETQA